MTVRICCLLPVALDPVGVWASVFRLNAAGSLAKQYLTDALKTGFDIGHGNGPLLHNFSLFGNLYECDFAIMSDGQAIANVRQLPHKDGSCCEVTYQDSTKETAILAAAIAIECAMEVLNNDAD